MDSRLGLDTERSIIKQHRETNGIDTRTIPLLILFVSFHKNLHYFNGM